MNVLYPSLALIGWTFIVLLRLGLLRYLAVRDRAIDQRFFALYREGEEPEKLRANSRHLQNLFEAPVLFYIISLISFVTETTTGLAIILAWSYVLLRFLHTFEHLTTNVVARRFALFLLSTLVLASLWGQVTFELLRQ